MQLMSTNVWSFGPKRRLNQGKRKAYKKRAGAAKKWKQFNMKEDISSSSSSSDVSEE